MPELVSYVSSGCVDIIGLKETAHRSLFLFHENLGSRFLEYKHIKRYNLRDVRNISRSYKDDVVGYSYTLPDEGNSELIYPARLGNGSHLMRSQAEAHPQSGPWN